MSEPFYRSNTLDRDVQRGTTGTTAVHSSLKARLIPGDRLVWRGVFQQATAPAYVIPPTPGSGVPTFHEAPTTYAIAADSRRPSGVWYSDALDAAAIAALPSTLTFSTASLSGRRVSVLRILADSDPTTPIAAASAWQDLSVTATQIFRDIKSVDVPHDDCLLEAWAYLMSNAVAAPINSTWTGMTELDDECAALTGTVSNSLFTASTKSVDTGATGTMRVTWPAGSVSSANGYAIAWQGVTAPPAPLATTMLQIIHRGIAASEQPASAEESTAGLDALMAAHPSVNGVEIDARLSSDGVPFLCHDADLLRVFGVSGTVEGKTAAQLDVIGVTRLSTYLEHAAQYGLRRILVQHYTAATQVAIQPIVDVILDSRVRHLVMVMTSVGTGPAFAAIRACGWTGLIGCYGITAATWTSTYAAQFATYSVDVAFAPPGAYDSNRALTAAVNGAGYQAGASTEDTSTVMLHANSDGVAYMLTNEPDVWESILEGPAPRTPLRWTDHLNEALDVLGFWTGSALVPLEPNPVTPA